MWDPNDTLLRSCTVHFYSEYTSLLLLTLKYLADIQHTHGSSILHSLKKFSDPKAYFNNVETTNRIKSIFMYSGKALGSTSIMNSTKMQTFSEDYAMIQNTMWEVKTLDIIDTCTKFDPCKTRLIIPPVGAPLTLLGQ